MKCEKKCEVYSRIVGYFRPVQNWNIGKKEEFRERLEYDECKSIGHKFKSEIEEVCSEAVTLKAEV